MTLYFAFIKQSSQHTVSKDHREEEKEVFFKTKFLLHAKNNHLSTSENISFLNRTMPRQRI